MHSESQRPSPCIPSGNHHVGPICVSGEIGDDPAQTDQAGSVIDPEAHRICDGAVEYGGSFKAGADSRIRPFTPASAART